MAIEKEDRQKVFERRYDPDDYDEVLAMHLRRVYDAYDKEDPAIYEGACADMTMELKTQWKCQMIGRDEAEEMKAYFWGFVE